MKKLLTLLILALVFPQIASAQTGQFIPFLRSTLSTSTSATTTNLHISSKLNFNSVSGDSWDDFCTSITGGSGLCDGTDATGSATFPFTVQSWGNSTSTTLGFLNGFLSTASSTFTTAPKFSTLTSALVQTDADGLTEEYAGTTCTNQFVRALSALGVATCATVGTADVAGLDISDDTNLASTWPIVLSGDTVTWGGLATTSNPTAGNLFYSNGTTGLVPVATSSVTINSPLTSAGTPGSVVGGSGWTLDVDDIGAADLASADFGSFTCNGTACTVDNTAISNAMLANSTISGIALGSNLTDLTAGTGLTSAGTYNGGTARTFSIDQSFTPTWTGAHIFNSITRSTTTAATTTNLFSTTASSTNLFASVVNFASSILSIVNGTLTGLGVWDLGGASSVEIPNSASPTVDAAGEIAVDTTSGQLKWFDGVRTHVITGTTSPALNLASTTMDANGKSFGVGTTSIHLKNSPEAMTLAGFYCKATSTAATTNTALVRFGDGTNWTTAGSCTTTGTFFPTSSNNTFTAYEDFIVQASSTAGAIDRLTITTVINRTAD